MKILILMWIIIFIYLKALGCTDSGNSFETFSHRERKCKNMFGGNERYTSTVYELLLADKRLKITVTFITRIILDKDEL